MNEKRGYIKDDEGNYRQIEFIDGVIYVDAIDIVAVAREEERERCISIHYDLVKEFRDILIDRGITNEALRGCVTTNQINTLFDEFKVSKHEAIEALTTPLPDKKNDV